MSQSQQQERYRKVLLSEVVVGLCSGFSVSPLNVVIDKSVIEYTSEKGKLWALAGENLKGIVKSPISFFTGFSFRWMYFVYASTYITSNLADHIDISSSISHPLQKLAMVFLVNTTCSLIKDKKYAVRYGAIIERPFPAISYALFFVRDLIAMASAFTIPPILGRAITKRINVSPENGERIAQLISPLAVQVVTTPIHLLALEIYNKPGEPFSNRIKHMKGIFMNSMLIRMMRFLPAYGIGGIINTELRRYLKGEINKH